MVIDCFPFLNEFDLLELRLRELSPVVDKFILCEATLTHSNKPKPLFYQDNRSRFWFYEDKIVPLVIDTYRGVNRNDPWALERYQKQVALDVATSYHPDAIVVTDCDEIPKREAVQRFLTGPDPVAALEMGLYYYWMNCRCVESQWDAGKVVRPNGTTLVYNELRKTPRKFKILRNSGWHFSYLGDIRYKLESFAHVEYSHAPYTDPAYIQQQTLHHRDLFGRELSFRIVEENGKLPAYVRERPDLYGKYFYTGQA